MNYNFLNKKLYLLLLLSIALISCAEEAEEKEELPPNSFKIYGKIENLNPEFMFFDGRDEEGNRVWDTVFVKNEQFEYIGKVYQPGRFKIWPNIERIKKRPSENSEIPTQSIRLEFFASEGDVIKFEGEVTEFMNAFPSGTTINDDLAKLNRHLFPLESKLADHMVLRSTCDNEQCVKKQVDLIEVLDKEILNHKIDFILSNTSSEVSAWLLFDFARRETLTDDQIVIYYQKLNTANLNSSTFYQLLKSRIEGFELLAIGNTVPSINSKDIITGDDFNLTDFRGKYVLLDFWGTWCAPCLAEMPKVREYQNKYQGKLVVVGINQGDRVEKIKKFIAKKKYNWIQIPAKNSEKDLVEVFGVSGFPTKILIDPGGKILQNKLGSGDETFELIDKLLKK